MEYSFDRDCDKSFLLCAHAGVGKTTAATGIIKTWEYIDKKRTDGTIERKYRESVVLCFTHAVIERLMNDSVFARTIDSFFGIE